MGDGLPNGTADIISTCRGNVAKLIAVVAGIRIAFAGDGTKSVTATAGTGLVFIQDEKRFRGNAEITWNRTAKAHSCSAITVFNSRVGVQAASERNHIAKTS